MRLAELRGRSDTLTARERPVVAVVAGRLNKQIAGELGVSGMTVRRSPPADHAAVQVAGEARLVRLAGRLGHHPAAEILTPRARRGRWAETRAFRDFHVLISNQFALSHLAGPGTCPFRRPARAWCRKALRRPPGPPALITAARRRAVHGIVFGAPPAARTQSASLPKFGRWILPAIYSRPMKTKSCNPASGPTRSGFRRSQDQRRSPREFGLCAIGGIHISGIAEQVLRRAPSGAC